MRSPACGGGLGWGNTHAAPAPSLSLPRKRVRGPCGNARRTFTVRDACSMTPEQQLTVQNLNARYVEAIDDG